MKRLPLPPLDLLLHLFYINPESPSGLRWRNPRSPKCKVNQIAGSKSKTGYWYVQIKTDKLRTYLTHRLVYFMTTGDDPGTFDVDHCFSNLDDNINIRKATKSQNGANRKLNTSSNKKPKTSKFKGVSWAKASKKWMAGIGVNGKTKNLGYFADEKDAARAYNEAALKYFGEFARLNNIDD